VVSFSRNIFLSVVPNAVLVFFIFNKYQ
jgi:hypothetical protein